ncbi:hypothetical protein FP2506_05916 [Fulvimarina pelagi HTCC2506]|uniref:Uncharacterized protein n=1 Tax=Fulvimarina pelagi HTCC2506 TaxID=314231 RepID=Q0G7L3_9HYPH|nr:hypothetical protein [Fulvimarina pelagi]EAU42351.1 hypothetical protein FP2506_05916 [Fulvimarina pelagi HTCC2506]
MVRSAGSGNSERQQRLQRELRTNLKRRREQAKARRDRATLMQDVVPEPQSGEKIADKDEDRG